MPTRVFKNAQLFLAGYELSGDMNTMALNYEAESLDATVFGNETRARKGGLKVSRVEGRGFYQAGSAKPDPVLFDSHGLDDVVVMLFPDNITEGATSSGSGYMFKATQLRFGFGGAVGDLLPFDVMAEGRGVGA